MPVVSICWVTRKEWPAKCAEDGVAPINDAYYMRRKGIVYAVVDAGKSVLHHEMGHVLDLPDHEHPQLPPKPKAMDYLKAVPAYRLHAKKVGFDSRAGSRVFRLKGPRHGQDRLLAAMLKAPVDIDQWKQMND